MQGPPMFFGRLYGSFAEGVRAHPFFYRVGGILLGIGILVILLRFVLGLGATTNMNDGNPWGIWIAFDVVVGTALGTGGFLMAIIIYVFNKWDYHPLIRSAVMTSAFGYTIAGISVIVDLGRWWNAPNLLAPWLYNTNSVLLEVALCIMAYTLVVWIEFVPVLLERRKDLPILQWSPLQKLLEHIAKYPKRWNRTLIVVISLGVLLPIMHQSSLGSMMVIAGAKVHPLWQTPVLPLLFLFSVAFMGYSVVVMESFASSHFLDRSCECHLIQRIIPVITVIGLIWIGLRFGTLFFEGKFGMFFGSGLYSIFFWTEIILVVAGTMVIMFKRYSNRPKYIFFSAFLLVAAGALYRMNTYLVAFSPGDGYVYFPSVIETLATLGFLALEVMLYILFIRVLPVLPTHEHETKQYQ